LQFLYVLAGEQLEDRAGFVLEIPCDEIRAGIKSEQGFDENIRSENVTVRGGEQERLSVGIRFRVKTNDVLKGLVEFEEGRFLVYYFVEFVKAYQRVLLTD
jgi:hypothetical protein